jgi:hypothetical protein
MNAAKSKHLMMHITNMQHRHVCNARGKLRFKDTTNPYNAKFMERVSTKTFGDEVARIQQASKL